MTGVANTPSASPPMAGRSQVGTRCRAKVPRTTRIIDTKPMARAEVESASST